MKRIGICLWALMAALSFAVAGCKKEGAIDTSKVSSAFSSAEDSVKAEADSAISAIKSADYSGALAKLQSLVKNVKLTPEQQQAIKDMIAQVQAKVTGAAQEAIKGAADSVKSAGEKAGDAASKAASDLQKSVGK